MDAVNSETLTQYFTLLRDVLTEHDLFAKPAQIYNVNESGIPFDPRAPNVVAKKEQIKCITNHLGRRGRLLLWGVCQCCRASDTTHGHIRRKAIEPRVDEW